MRLWTGFTRLSRRSTRKGDMEFKLSNTSVAYLPQTNGPRSHEIYTLKNLLLHAAILKAMICSPSFHAYDIQDTCISIDLQAARAIPSDGVRLQRHNLRENCCETRCGIMYRSGNPLVNW